MATPKHIDYNHPLRQRGKSDTRSWALYASDVPHFKPKHTHRVDGLTDPGWVIVERIHYNGAKYYEYWHTHDEQTFWIYESYYQARRAQYMYPLPQSEPHPGPTPEPQPKPEELPSVDMEMELTTKLLVESIDALDGAEYKHGYDTWATCNCPATMYHNQTLCKHIRKTLGEDLDVPNIGKYEVILNCNCKAFMYNSSVPCKHLRWLLPKK